MNSRQISEKSFLRFRITFLCILSLFIVNFGFAEKINNEKSKLAFTLPFEKTGKARSVTYLKDRKGRKFVLKHHRSSEHAIHETIATKVGMSVKVPINQVEIFSAESTQTKDYNDHRTTTLHTHVPGCEVQDKKEYDEINIYRGIQDTFSLESITKHSDLCDIVALDIFVNNIDRHVGNFFVEQGIMEYPQYTLDIESYGSNFFMDQAFERFYAIDMDFSYDHIIDLSESIDYKYERNLKPNEDNFIQHTLSDYLLATKACDFLEKLEPKQLSDKEIKALKRVNQTLGKLIDKYPVEKQYNEWMNIADKVNYTYCPTKKENIQIALEYNMHEVKRLYAQINTIVKNHHS